MTATQDRMKKQRAWLPIAGVIAVLAILAGVTVLKQRGPSSNEMEGAADAVLPTTSQLDSAASGADDTTGVAARALAPAKTSQQAVQQVLASREQGRAEQSERNAREKNALIGAFRSEKADPAWAAPTEQNLQRLASDPSIAAAGIEADDVAIDCKRTTCRTSASFASGGQADDWSMLYMASVGSTLRNSVVIRTQNTDGTTSLDIYSKAK